MSMSAVQEFLTKVSEDQGLQEQVAKAMESGNDRQAVTDLARTQGFDFTADELSQEIEARQADFQKRQAAGELADEEMEAVSGGEFVVLSIGTPPATVTVHMPLFPGFHTKFTQPGGTPGRVKW